MATTDRHPEWFAARTRLCTKANGLAAESKAFDDCCAAMSTIEVKLITVPAANPAEALARLQFAAALHAEGSVLNQDDAADMIANAVSILAPIAQPAEPLTWDQGVTAYVVAKANELTFDEENGLNFEASLPGAKLDAAINRVPKGVWDESSRLSDLRGDAEDVLMAIPSPDAAAFAFKYLIAHGDGRDTDGWNAMLEAEAKRFAGA